MRLALILLTLTAPLLGGCVLDVVDAGWTLATGRHIDAGWYGNDNATVTRGQCTPSLHVVCAD